MGAHVKSFPRDLENIGSDNDNDQWLTAADQLTRIAEQLRFSAGHVPIGSTANGAKDRARDYQLLRLAENLLRQRKDRSLHLRQDFFGDTAWAILLDLYVAGQRGKPLSTTSVCLGTLMPQTTALRWLELLVMEGLVDRQLNTKDKRVKHVALTTKGREAVTAVLNTYF